MGASQNDPASSVLQDMEPDLLEFIRVQVNSFLKWDLVRFFHDNPHTADSAANIARYTGRDVQAITPELAALAESGMLTVDDVGGLAVYTLTTDPAIRDLVSRFVAACDDRNFKVTAVYHVIRSVE